MKIYRISQSINIGYDVYDAFVVNAKSRKGAKFIHDLDKKNKISKSWVENEKDIKVEYLGKAKKGAKKGIILSSFNAG